MANQQETNDFRNITILHILAFVNVTYTNLKKSKTWWNKLLIPVLERQVR